jgi:hypothetical protein
MVLNKIRSLLLQTTAFGLPGRELTNSFPGKQSKLFQNQPDFGTSSITTANFNIQRIELCKNLGF